MTFISYAQNFEDVMLWRALKDVENGFYIDVGANDPVIDSVTKAFYDAGWHGINIDPVDEWFKKLEQQRPNDTNLKVAIGTNKGSTSFYEVVGTGLSTMDKETAQKHEKEHGFEIREYKVPTASLTSICQQYKVQDIHFLKVDVEGAELAVLQGIELEIIRPWIILVESTLPNSQEENYTDWETSLTSRGYHYIYFDGLNRYYVADERKYLDKSFAIPPNYFDYFQRAHENYLNNCVETLQASLITQETQMSAQLAEANAREIQLSTQLEEASARETQLSTQLDEANARETQLSTQLDEANAQRIEALARVDEARINMLAQQNQFGVQIAEMSASLTQAQIHIAQYEADNNRTRLTTAPLHWLLDMSKWVLQGGIAWITFKPGSRPRRMARLGVLHLRNWVMLRPRIKAKISSLLGHFPRLNAWAKRLHYASVAKELHLQRPGVETKETMTSEMNDQLSTVSAKIYNDLKSAIARQQGTN